VLVSSFLLAFAGGCSQQSQDEAKQNAESGAGTAKRVGSNMASSASQSMGKLGATMSKDASADLMSGKVKSALSSAEGLDASHIHVDTNGKTVVISGFVDSAAHKTQAIGIAKGIAGTSYQVKNLLGVQAAS
jgi:osmotically-inducible protein OsmY